MADKNTDGTPKTTTKRKRNRGKGKAIIARMENVDGKSGVLLASSKKKAISTTLHWNMDGKKANEAFVLSITLPDGKGGEQVHPIYMGKAQALAVYEGHPRRVEAEALPPSCPLAPKPTA